MPSPSHSTLFRCQLEPKQLFRALLASDMPASSLLAGLMLDITNTLSSPLKKMGVTDAATQDLFRILSRRLLMVQNLSSGLRRVSVCNDRAVFLVPLQGSSGRGGISRETMLIPAGVASGLVSRPRAVTKSPRFWEIMPVSHWHILIVDWLGQELSSWLPTQHPYLDYLTTPTAVTARELAAISGRDVPDHIVALQVALLDTLGYPRVLTRYCLRNQQREQNRVTADWQASLIRHWPWRQAWSGRALKLYPLAVMVAETTAQPTLGIRDVRDVLLSLGLSRNAWAHLYRLPAVVVTALAQDLCRLVEESDRALYVANLSRWLSRLGHQYRYYALDRNRLQCALLWPLRELTFLRSTNRDTVSDSFDRQEEARLLRGGFTGLEFMLRREDYSVADLDRLELLLLGFTQYILSQAQDVWQQFSSFQNVLDWFHANGRALPLSAFKRRFTEAMAHSTRWHAEELCEQEQEEEEWYTGQESMLALTSPTLCWTVPLPIFEKDGARFNALLTSQELKAEGQLMQHCVSSYSVSCANHKSFIYAVSYEGQRVGTLEMGFQKQQSWFIRQFKGLHNQELRIALENPGSKLHEPFQYFMAALRNVPPG